MTMDVFAQLLRPKNAMVKEPFLKKKFYVCKKKRSSWRNIYFFFTLRPFYSIQAPNRMWANTSKVNRDTAAN